MAQFDVFANPSASSQERFPFLVDIQNDLLRGLSTRIVVPLAHPSVLGDKLLRGLTPEIRFNGQGLILMTPELSSIHKRHLGDLKGSLVDYRAQIIAAMDFALTGI